MVASFFFISYGGGFKNKHSTPSTPLYYLSFDWEKLHTVRFEPFNKEYYKTTRKTSCFKWFLKVLKTKEMVLEASMGSYFKMKHNVVLQLYRKSEEPGQWYYEAVLSALR